MATQRDLGSWCQKAFCAVKAQEKLSPGPSPDPNITERETDRKRERERKGDTQTRKPHAQYNHYIHNQ